jgi:hypothetical protein
MKLKTKAAIFLAALALSIFGFSLIAASSIDVFRIGKEAGYQIIANYLENSAADHVPHKS